MLKQKAALALALLTGMAVLLTGCPGVGISFSPGTTASSDAGAAMTPDTTSTPGTTTKATTTAKLTPTEKPAIYLYPQRETEVRVQLAYQGRLTCTYPAYPADGWRVSALPDGRIISQADGRAYSYLYWEGLTDTIYDFSRGFVVAGVDTVSFLQEKLARLGLTPREANEFIVYWLPRMQENPYNLITFQGKAYTDSAILSIEPKPDSLLRVFMAYRPLREQIEIAPQALSGFKREGFAVVEWGGACVE